MILIYFVFLLVVSHSKGSWEAELLELLLWNPRSSYNMNPMNSRFSSGASSACDPQHIQTHTGAPPGNLIKQLYSKNIQNIKNHHHLQQLIFL